METDEHSNGRPRLRAGRACTSCNARRIRCNVAQVSPCFNCQSGGFDCQVVPSKRGRRKQSASSTRDATQKQRYEQQPRSPQTIALTNDHIAWPLQAEVDSSEVVDLPSNNPVSSSLTGSKLFFGESNALTCVSTTSTESPEHQSHHPPQRTGLFYPVLEPDTTADQHSDESKALKARVLDLQGALEQPLKEQCDPVFQAYFEWFHPCFPIIDKAGFATLYDQDDIPLVLLNAILFAGMKYCSEDVIHGLGYSDLRSARSTFFNRAKVLLDADWETNNLAILQAMFLLSFLRAPMNSAKGHRYWLSTAVNLAQAHGLHRLSSLSASTSKQAKLNRRIWWALYVRDRHMSASLGLPPQIRDQDCDVEMVSVGDLQDDYCLSIPWLQSPPTAEQIVYVTRMPPLMTLLGRIVGQLYSPSQRPSRDQDLSELTLALGRWKSDLPTNMQTAISDDDCNLWVSMLHLAYNHVLILLHRGDFLQQTHSAPLALQAARRISSITESLLSCDMVRYSQLYSITSLFTALCLHTLNLQRSHGVAQNLAESRARTCLLGLKEIQRSWAMENDILALFFQHLGQDVAEKLQRGTSTIAESTMQQRNWQPGSLTARPYGRHRHDDQAQGQMIVSHITAENSGSEGNHPACGGDNHNPIASFPAGGEQSDDFWFFFTGMEQLRECTGDILNTTWTQS